MKTAIIIPTFNERENIKELVVKINSILPNLFIVVVDDDSPDATSKVVESLAKKNKRIRLVVRKERRGLGAAYVSGMRYSYDVLRVDAVIIMDADLSHDPRAIPLFLEKLEKGADLVIGSRYIMGGGIAKRWALHRKFLSIFGNKIVRLILGRSEITDWTSGYRGIRREVFTKVLSKIKEDKAEYKGYSFNVSFTYHALSEGFTVSEVPIKFGDRRSGASKLGLEYLFFLPVFLFKTRLSALFRSIFKV